MVVSLGFGMLVALTLVLALVADFFVMPSLMFSSAPRERGLFFEEPSLTTTPRSTTTYRRARTPLESPNTFFQNRCSNSSLKTYFSTEPWSPIRICFNIRESASKNESVRVDNIGNTERALPKLSRNSSRVASAIESPTLIKIPQLPEPAFHGFHLGVHR